MTLMQHFLAHTNQTAPSHRMPSSTPWFWQALGITACIWLGLATEGWACHVPVNPTSLTFYAVQGSTNPPSQIMTVSNTITSTKTVTASDNATWLTVSPTSASMTTSAKIKAAVSTSGRAAGTYKATTTIKVATWCTYTIPVTLIISPAGGGGGVTMSTASLAWDAVAGTVSGYKVYVWDVPPPTSGVSNSIRTITVGTGRSTIVNSLTVGKTYYFAITAYNSAGESARSNVVSKTIP